MEANCQECNEIVNLHICEGDEPGKYDSCKCLKFRQELAEIEFGKKYRISR